MPGNARDVVVGWFDEDQLDDVAVVHQATTDGGTSDGVTVWFQDGATGDLQLPSTFPTTGPPPPLPPRS